jgi:hypothetical protein
MARIEIDLEGNAGQLAAQPVIIVDPMEEMSGDRFDAPSATPRSRL